jgi:CTP:molybdopterin cytidylyltransferase MocA
VTVAAVILASSPASALADADGMASVRRIADVAWSGGAVPIVVVAADPGGSVAAALAGSAVTLAEPAAAEAGPAGQMARGADVARAEVSDTGAVLIWPARLTWVGPETVTSLIEAHGVSPELVLRPAYEGDAGWPAVVPFAGLDALRALPATLGPDEAVAEVALRLGERRLDLGDPGTVHDRSVARRDLPPYTGPAEPAGGHVHEWGAAAAEQPDDGPLAGPALAPYGQAVAADPEQPG